MLWIRDKFLAAVENQITICFMSSHCVVMSSLQWQWKCPAVWSWDSMMLLWLGYGVEKLRNHVSISGKSKRFLVFLECPYQLWDPPSHLFSAYWGLFSGLRFSGRETGSSPPSSLSYSFTLLLLFFFGWTVEWIVEWTVTTAYNTWNIAV